MLASIVSDRMPEMRLSTHPLEHFHRRFMLRSSSVSSLCSESTDDDGDIRDLLVAKHSRPRP